MTGKEVTETSYTLVERVERLEARVRRREESERVEQAIREYGE